MSLFLELALVFGGASVVFLLMAIACAIVLGRSE